jgi:hypothetical protein
MWFYAGGLKMDFWINETLKRDHGSVRKGGNNGTTGKELIRSFPVVPLFPPFLIDP